MRTKLAPLALGVLVICVAAACGGSGGGSSTTTAAATSTATTPAQQKAAIERVWTAFFSSKTSPQQRAMYLQNGAKFEQAIREQSKSPLAQQVSSTVKSVTLQGPADAKVVYSIDLAGKPALKNRVRVEARSKAFSAEALGSSSSPRWNRAFKDPQIPLSAPTSNGRFSDRQIRNTPSARQAKSASQTPAPGESFPCRAMETPSSETK